MDLLASFRPVIDEIAVGDRLVALLRPPSAEDLIDEDDYARDERLPYWAEIWPSGRVLAEALAAAPLAGRRVLELGCGLGLAAVAALLAGGDVLATDWYPEALEFARANALRVTGRELPTMLIDWRDPSSAFLARAPFDLVAAADVLYEARNAHALGALLPRLVSRSGEAWIADPRRPDAALLVDALMAEGWGHACEATTHSGRVDESGPVVNLHRLAPPG